MAHAVKLSTEFVFYVGNLVNKNDCYFRSNQYFLRVGTPCSVYQPQRIRRNLQTPSNHATTDSKQFPSVSKTTTASYFVSKFPPSVQAYLRLSRFDKPTGALLALWPGLWSVGLAVAVADHPSLGATLSTCLLFGAGGFLVRSAGCIINDMWDCDFDRQVERTRSRPLASGEIQFFPALVYLGATLSLALMILLQFNLYTIIVGACCIPLVTIYPFMKRLTYWPQLALGLAFNWGALMGYCALHGFNHWSVVLPLYFGCVFWSTFYDTIYAYQDVADDKKIGVKSTALRFGANPTPWLVAFGAATLSGWTAAGYMAGLSWPFYASMGVAAVHMTRQLARLDINSTTSCWNTFRSNQQLGPLLMAGILLGSYV